MVQNSPPHALSKGSAQRQHLPPCKRHLQGVLPDGGTCTAPNGTIYQGLEVQSTRLCQPFSIVSSFGSSNLHLQFELYHCSRKMFLLQHCTVELAKEELGLYQTCLLLTSLDHPQLWELQSSPLVAVQKRRLRSRHTGNQRVRNCSNTCSKHPSIVSIRYISTKPLLLIQNSGASW